MECNMGASNLSSERKKALRNSHPLYSRLSGEVVWGIFEELGYDTERCGREMDAFLAGMEEVLMVMDRVESDAAAYVTLLRHPSCGRCEVLPDEVVPASYPEWRRFLPLFAVGCRMGCAVLDDAQGRPVLSGSRRPPRCTLICPLLSEEQS